MKEKTKKGRGIKEMKGRRGITLIALIITIIVMLILVAVTINVAISSGLFKTAKKAVRKTDLAKLQEDWWVTKYANYNTTTDRTDIADGPLSDVFEDKYEQYNDQFAIENGELVYVGTDETMKQYVTELGIAISLPHYVAPTGDNVLTANAKYTDLEGGEAIIPKGFKVVGYDPENKPKVSDGLVIQDASGNENESGNEFVWIPVTYTKKNIDTDGNGYDDGFDEVFYRSDWVANAETGGKRGTTLAEPYTEPYTTSDYTTEKNEYDAMVASVEANKGFYIGRYEAGSTVERTSSSAPATTPVVKKDQYPYNYVQWGTDMKTIGEIGAVYLSQQMYPKNSEDYGVASTLCYGVQWDAVLEFIKDSTHDVTNSTSWGNYNDAVFQYYDGTQWKDRSSEDQPLKTGVDTRDGADDNRTNRNCAKNIYDIAGNVWEWTMEANGSSYRVRRGGCGYYGDYPASSRGGSDPNSVNYDKRLSPHTLHKVAIATLCGRRSAF